MKTQTIKLIDQARKTVALAQVVEESDHFVGTIDLAGASANYRALFEEFEEIVNGQMFIFLDEIQDKMNALPLKAAFENGREVPVKDLQVFPNAAEVSFKLATVPAASMKSA
jgi:hypothetical protein